MSAVPFSPDCSYCILGNWHGLPEHVHSIGLTVRLRRMAGPQAEEVLREPRRGPAELRTRIARLEQELEECTRRMTHYERVAVREGNYQQVIDGFLARQERLTDEIGVLRVELEGWL